MRIKRLNKTKILPPKRANADAAGYDLRSNLTLTIKSGERVSIPTGFAWEIPTGMVGIIKPRSGLANDYGLDVLAGVIDSDYRGEIKVILLNTGSSHYKITQNDRIAQMVVANYLGEELEEVNDLSDSDRGSKGLGSTGKK